MNLENAQPLISICVPTYNRSESLRSLFEVLLTVKKAHRDIVEVCVSNNCSSDDTAKIIAEWRSVLDITDIIQSENIGSMRNCVAVTSISSGKWVLMMGDDDSINTSNFSKLLESLHTIDANWLFCGVGDPSGNEYLLGDLTEGRYTKKEMQKEMIRVGLYRFGFVGMHIFPGELRDTFAALTISQIESWPHIGLLMQQFSSDGDYLVSHAPIVIQAANENELFWHAGNWVKVNVCKIKITAEAWKKNKTDHIFHLGVMLRELYSYTNLKELTLWRVLEHESFYKDSFPTYFKVYSSLKLFRIFSAGHLFALTVLHLVPTRMLKLILVVLNKYSILSIYDDIRDSSKSIDGIQRGL
jgi:glycosyltransferase involved in cell wall biosynthesis